MNFNQTTAAIVVDAFEWHKTQGCNNESLFCSDNYKMPDAPIKADQCLKESGPDCSIWFETNVLYTKASMCTMERDLWVDISVSRGWVTSRHRGLSLLAVGANGSQCYDFTIARVSENDTTTQWCSPIEDDVAFHALPQLDGLTFSVPTHLRLYNSKWLIFRSPPFKECWTSINDMSALAIVAEYRKSNEGASAPEYRGSFPDHCNWILGISCMFSVILLLVMRKISQANMHAKQAIACEQRPVISKEMSF